jgi:hypothetical protein
MSCRDGPRLGRVARATERQPTPIQKLHVPSFIISLAGRCVLAPFGPQWRRAGGLQQPLSPRRGASRNVVAETALIAMFDPRRPEESLAARKMGRGRLNFRRRPS